MYTRRLVKLQKVNFIYSQVGVMRDGAQTPRANGSRHLGIPLEVRSLIRFESGPDY